MQMNRNFAGTTILVAALLIPLFVGGTAHAQGTSSTYKGKFTLQYQVRWGGSILQPGDYTFTINSSSSPAIALVRTADGNAVTHVISGSFSERTNGANALLIKEKGGQLVVHSLALADLGVVFVYDPALAQESVKEARGKQAVPVILSAKK